MTGPRRLIGRAAALGILGLVLWTAWRFAVMPISEHVAAIDETTDLNKQMVGRLVRGIAEGDGGESLIRTAYGQVTESGRFVLAETAPLAAARMQQHLGNVVASEGGELQSVQSLPSKDESGLTRIGLRVMMRGSYESILRLLYSLETEKPILFVNNVQMKAERARRRSDDPDEAETMILIFEVLGYLPPAVGE